MNARLRYLGMLFIENFRDGFRKALPWGLAVGILLMAWGAAR